MSDESLVDDLEHARLIERLTPAMREAGRLIEQIRADGFESRRKADRSLVTAADEAAEQLLEAAIRALDRQGTIIGEEAAAAGLLPAENRRFWLIDPLDGTRDFVGGGTDYSVNVGLVSDGVPVLGLVLHPPTGTLWTGAPGLGAWKEDAEGRRAIAARALANPPAIVASRSHLDDRTKAWIAAVPDAIISHSGSSLKICLLAEGEADIYPRFGPTSEWDTAAADAILRAAGGMIFAEGGENFPYAKAKYLNGSFLALGDPDALARLPRF